MTRTRKPSQARRAFALLVFNLVTLLASGAIIAAGHANPLTWIVAILSGYLVLRLAGKLGHRARRIYRRTHSITRAFHL